MYKIDDMCRAKLTQPNTRPSLRLQVLEINTPTYVVCNKIPNQVTLILLQAPTPQLTVFKPDKPPKRIQRM